MLFIPEFIFLFKMVVSRSNYSQYPILKRKKQMGKKVHSYLAKEKTDGEAYTDRHKLF